MDGRFRNFFEEIYALYNKKEFIHTDPIFYPHTLGGNTEFVALTAACFAYGNVKAIKSFLLSFFEHYGTEPESLNEEHGGLYYRFQKQDDVAFYAEFMKRLYGEYGSIENIFSRRETLEEGVGHFYDTVKKESEGAGQGFMFLFPNPATSGAKRLRMFLRWMVRRDDVDFGMWNSFSQAELKMPIDTHILRFAKNNGIISSDAASRKNLETVSSFFCELNANDPAKYDFALTRLGIVNDCKYQECEQCTGCVHKKACVFM